MLIYSFITDYQAFNLRYKDNTTRDKNETKVGKQSANLGKNNEPIQNRLSFLIDCQSVILHHLTILSFPMVRPTWDNWWLLPFLQTRAGKTCFLITALHGIDDGRQHVARIALRWHQSSDAQYPEPLWHYLFHRSCCIAHLPAMGCSAGKKYPEENASMEFCRQKDEKSKQIMRTFKEKHYLCI